MRGAPDRRARYACVAILMRDARVLADGRGECAGRILESPRGHGGFGYDPWFESDELRRTFAESSAEQKGRVSHRARAVRAVIEWLARNPSA
jgi:XTP/dITP diphosphohydrolase